MPWTVPAPGSAVVHGVFVALGCAVGVAVFALERRRRGLDDDRLWTIVATGLAGGAVLARLGTWLQHADLRRNATLVEQWLHGNRSILSGLVGAWLGVHLGKRLTGYRESTGDLFAPAAAAAMAFGRIGCLLTEKPGTPTGGGWGIRLDDAAAAALGAPARVGLHPSFVYEIAFHATAFVVLWRARDAARRPGDLFIGYVAAYAVFRFAVEFVRGNEVVAAGLTRPQWFLLTAAPLLTWRVVTMIRTPRPSGHFG